MLFGRKLRALRKKRSLSQEQLGFEAGLDRTYISDIELGRRNVALLNICNLANALGVAPGALLDFGSEDQNESPA